MSFHVSTGALRNAAGHLGTMADAYPDALAYVRQHVVVPGGGNIIDSIKYEIERARTDLEGVYAADGALPAYLRGASEALVATADDYDTVDAASRAAFDALLPQVDVPTTSSGAPDWGFDAGDETAGVSTADLTGELVAPSGFFEGLDTWRSILDNVSYATSLLWVFDALFQMPFYYELPKPTQDLRDTFNGDWESVGNVALALDALKDFHDRLQDETGASVLDLQAAWGGRAADAASGSLSVFVAAVDDHRRNLQLTSDGLEGFAVGMRFLTDALCGALDTLAGIVLELLSLNPFDLLDWIRRGGSQVLRWFNVINNAIELVILCIDLAFALVSVFPLTLGQWGRYPCLSIPRADVPVLTAPDVDGP